MAKLSLSAMILIGLLSSASAFAQPSADAPATAPSADDSAVAPIRLDWVPEALATLQSQAAVQSSFTLDRTMLAAAAGLVGDTDAETRNVIAKLDGVSVHLLRFGDNGIADQSAIEAVRSAYHQRGLKHLVTSSGRGTLQGGTTDVWIAMDGTNLRGAVILAESPKSLALVTVTGNLSPIDLLHLRGHFGIPRFDAGGMNEIGSK